MFDLSLAQIIHAERERDLTADLRGRQALKSTIEETASEPAPLRRSVAQRTSAKRVRAVGR